MAIESNNCLIDDEFSWILILNWSAKLTISIALLAPAAIDGHIDVVKINPGEKLRI